MYIKRFESLEISDSIESCKDIIETIKEYEDDVYIYDYKIGFLHQGDVVSDMKDERSKKVIRFRLQHKNDAPEDGYKQLRMITEKSEIDELIAILQKSKSLLNKFKIYCDDIKLETNNNSVKFSLQFENTDSEQKVLAKRKRIFSSIKNKFLDYRFEKTIEVEKESNPQLFNHLEKFKQKNYNNSSYLIRFTLDITQDKNKIFLSPKTFRCKVENWDDNYIQIRSKFNIPFPTWYKLKSDKIIVSAALSYIKERLKKSYDVDIKNLDILTTNKSLEITTD